MKIRKCIGFTIIELMAVVAMVAIMSALLVSVSNSAKRNKEQKQQEKTHRDELVVYNPERVTTVENCSYVTINLPGSPQINKEIILRVIANFERARPELKIIGTPVPDARQNAHGTPPFTFGVWIYHEPKSL